MEPESNNNTSLDRSGFHLARRVVGLIIALPCIAVLYVAANQIEVRDKTCLMVVRTGLPCPTCGMTRSFRASVRGDLAAGFRHQPFGPFLCLITVALAVAGTGQAITGRGVLIRMCPNRPIDPLGILNVQFWPVLVGVVGTIAGWGMKILLHHLAGELPLG